MTATVTLLNNQVVANTASYGGGGVYLGQSAGQLANNIIFDNRADTGGGGLFVFAGSPALNGNMIRSNTSENLGGGLYLFSADATLQGNTIRGNTAAQLGGGLDVASCSPTLSDNLFVANTARQGGGAYLWYSASALINNVFVDNATTAAGSGLWIGGSQLLLLHTTIARNSGGDGSGVVVTDAGDTPSAVTMTNTALTNHARGISVTAGSDLTLNGILWFSTPITVSPAGASVTVQNQVQGNPAFGADGYHVTAGSAALNRGVPAGVRVDIDGQPRTFGIPDLGADEYWPAGLPKVFSIPLILR
jgi:parallel beta-helix repeat protein